MALRDPIGDWLRRRITHTEIIDGIALTIVAAEWEPIAARVRSAIELIRQHDPYRLKVLRRYLTGGVQVDQSIVGRIAEFDWQTMTCKVHPDYINSEASPEELATTLVHEATHARLWHLGFRYESAQSRVREEANCMRQEIAFAQRVPGGAAIAETVQRQLKCLDPSDYDDAAFNRRYIARRLRLVRRARKSGVPGWLLRCGGLIARPLKRGRDKQPVPAPRARGEGHAGGAPSARR